MLLKLLRANEKFVPPSILPASLTSSNHNSIGEALLQVPPGDFAAPGSNDDEALKRKREEIRQRLLRGEKVVVDKSGSMQVPSSDNRDAIQVPPGKLALPGSNDDEALKRKREEIRQRLLRGEKVVVDKSGSMQVPSSENRDAIQVPPGKLASSDSNDDEGLADGGDNRIQTILRVVRECLCDMSSSSLDKVIERKTSIRGALANLASDSASNEALKRKREDIRRHLLAQDGVSPAHSNSPVTPAPNDGEALQRKRAEIRERLLRGDEVVVDKSGSIHGVSTHDHGDPVPPGRLANPASSDDEVLKRKREEIRQRLLDGEKVVVDKSGSMRVPSSENRDAIQVPPGKLAASFHWYKNDPELYQAEVEQMRRLFPQFTIQHEDDGRLSWIGAITPGLLHSGARSYTLQVVYDNNHPHASTYGGSIKVYSIDPDLEEFTQIESLPHLLRDSNQQLYLCTSRPGDFTRGGDSYGSAATAIAWAVKWFSVFEMWLNGDVSKAEFADHRF
jgi:hypothetical protein